MKLHLILELIKQIDDIRGISNAKNLEIEEIERIIKQLKNKDKETNKNSNSKICIARVWNHGQGARCNKKVQCLSGVESEFCGMHLKNSKARKKDTSVPDKEGIFPTYLHIGRWDDLPPKCIKNKNSHGILRHPEKKDKEPVKKDKETAVKKDKETAIKEDKEPPIKKDKETAVKKDKETAVKKDKEPPIKKDKEPPIKKDKKPPIKKDKEPVKKDRETAIKKDKEYDEKIRLLFGSDTDSDEDEDNEIRIENCKDTGKKYQVNNLDQCWNMGVDILNTSPIGLYENGEIILD